MSEEKTILGGTPVVEFDDVVEFFSKRATNPCPTCGYTKWSVSGPLKGAEGPVSAGLVGVRLATGATLTQGIPLVLATCKKCAYVRMHGLADISQWIANGKPDFTEDE